MKSKNYAMILYQENEKDMMTLEKIKKNYKYAYIIHDKDTTEDGEIKKEHIHVFMEFENERSIKSIAKELNVEEYDVEKIRNKIGAIRYLIHKDNPEKHQYQQEKIVTNIKNINKYLKDKKSENEEMAEIIQYIYSKKRRIMIVDVICYCIDNNLYNTYRRAGNQIIKLIDEHNNIYNK